MNIKCSYFKTDLLSCVSNPHCKQYCHLNLLSSGILPWNRPLWAAGVWQRPCYGVSTSKPRFVKRWGIKKRRKKRDVKTLTLATSTLLKKNLNKWCDLHSSNLSQRSDRGGESLRGPTSQNCNTNDAFMNNEVCLTPQSLGQEYLVASNMITNCTLLKFNINFVLFARLHNCLCVCEGSVFVGTLRKYFQSNGAQMLLTSQWCFCGELGPWWTHGLGLIYKLHFELLSPHIPKTSPLESRQSDKLITESGNRIEKAEG